jgi:hypothetical protein
MDQSKDTAVQPGAIKGKPCRWCNAIEAEEPHETWCPFYAFYEPNSKKLKHE